MSSPVAPSLLRLRLLLGLLAVCYFASFAFYPRLFWWAGVSDYGVWFLDTFAILASNDAVSRGLDPWAVNRLDWFGRPHVYSHWWLHLRDLGLTRAHNFALGFGLVSAFGLAALSWLRPRTPRTLLFFAAVLCSSPILLAINRANNDLVVFLVLTPVVSCLLAARPAVRCAAPLLIAAAAGLKFYPAAAALVLLAPAAARELRWRLAFAVVLLALVGADIAGDLVRFAPVAPKPEGLMSFGAVALFNGLGWTGLAPKLLTLAAAATIFAWSWRTRPLGDWTPAPAAQTEWLHFILGASLLAGCFFAGMSHGYRWVFALWLAPQLWTLAHDTENSPTRRLARLTAALLLAVLWLDALFCLALNRLLHVVTPATLTAWADRLFLLEQPVTWAFFGCLLLWLAHFTRAGLGALFPPQLGNNRGLR